MTQTDRLFVDQLQEVPKKPEDLIGKNGLLTQRPWLLVECALEAETSDQMDNADTGMEGHSQMLYHSRLMAGRRSIIRKIAYKNSGTPA
ncbi:hypothetical protein ACO0LC_10090 [Undibacterium sp. JH2W]|uniref:hypothetical protein n=1 Tax=Undibacterium sp. JH2W TaxID=3413037 RepID=UPI003BF221CA